MPKKVALVEDEPFIIEALSFILERVGLEVVSCSDGAKAIPFIKSTKPDLVILDIMLPNKSGMEIIEELRGSTDLPYVPVLMLTAKGQKKDRKAAEDASVDLFMTKPFSNKELVANVLELLKNE